MRILICTDGSDQSERATRLGCEVAVACQADVTLFGIKETTGGAEVIQDALRRAQQLFETHKIAAEAVTKAGQPIEEIVKRTEDLSYDLVVIGAVRKGRYGPFSMSSKAYKIVKLIKPPVLVSMGNPPAIKRMLLCTGGKGYIESAFDLIGKVAKGTGSSVTLLHVMAQVPAIYSEIQRLERDIDLILNSTSELGRNLRREKESLTSMGIPTEVRLRQGFVLEEISKEIQENQYDLIVAGSSLSTGPLRTYVLGDVTREIVDRAECPVLVARHTERPINFAEKVRDFFHSFSFTTPPSKGPGVKQSLAEATQGVARRTPNSSLGCMNIS